MRKLLEDLKHKVNVFTWKMEIYKKAKPIAKTYGYKKNSYDYQMLLHDIANRE